MSFILQPWQLLFAILCGWVNERQQKTIEFQNAQIETLLQKLGKKRLLLNDGQRRLLAVKAKAIGRKALMGLTTIVTPARSCRESDRASVASVGTNVDFGRGSLLEANADHGFDRFK